MRARRPKARRLDHGPLRGKVGELLRADRSLEQISETLPTLFVKDARMRVSHETIYQSLFVQTKGELKRADPAHLRSRRMTRKAQTGGAKRVTVKITADIPISARPAEADDRAVPGHWESDLLLGGTGKGAVVTLVERSSRFVLLAPLTGRHTAEVVRWMLSEMIATLPLSLCRSITWDRGSEIAQHAQFECDDVALRLNTRPREALEWKTPGQALNGELVAAAV